MFLFWFVKLGGGKRKRNHQTCSRVPAFFCFWRNGKMDKKRRTANINKRSRCSGEVSIAIVLHCKQCYDDVRRVVNFSYQCTCKLLQSIYDTILNFWGTTCKDIPHISVTQGLLTLSLCELFVTCRGLLICPVCACVKPLDTLTIQNNNLCHGVENLSWLMTTNTTQIPKHGINKT